MARLRHRLRTIALCVGCSAMGLGVEARAEPLQPLAVFLRAAKRYGDNNRQAAAQSSTSQEQLKAATGRLLPSLTAQGAYTRNQFHADFSFPAAAGSPATRLTFLPSNQLDGTITLSVPIVDLENYGRRTVALKSVKAAAAAFAATQQATDRQVAQAYYSLIGQQRVHEASQRSLGVVQRAEAIARDRFEAGVGAPLELERALADTARAQQSVTDAALGVALAQRTLESLATLAPQGQAESIVDDLHAELPLAQWIDAATIHALPGVVAATARTQASLAGLKAAKFGYVPTLTAKAQEKFSNLTGLNGGHAAMWAISASVAWNLDFTLTPLKRAQAAQVQFDLAAEHQAIRQTQDSLFEDWHRVHAGIDRCRAARQESRAAALAANISLEQYAVGSDTQLDVLQATKDAFTADVRSIQADSDLIFARALLRIDAGQAPVSEETDHEPKKAL